MPIVEPELAPLQIPRIASLATSAFPVWLWSADASRIVWANAAGAAIFGAATVADSAKLQFGTRDAVGSQIVRLAATLPSGGQERLERLRGFGAGFGRPLMCLVSRIVLPEGNAAVLIASTEAAGPALPLRERVRRQFSDSTVPLAVFAPEGALLCASASATPLIGKTATLSTLGIATIAESAFSAGRASGPARIGANNVDITALRLGQDHSRVLLVTMPVEAIGLASKPATPIKEPATVPVAPIAPPVQIVAEPTDIQQHAPSPQPDLPPQQTIEAPTEPPSPAPAADSPSPAPEAVAASAPADSLTQEHRQTHAPVADRRHPLRFVWQMDPDGRFVVGSDEFMEIVGPRTTAACGRRWSDIAAELKLDPDDQITRAIATRETWSGIQISWPVDESRERLPVELSGLPIFDRDRTFHGYRGFGVCRDVDRVNVLARSRRDRPIGFVPLPLSLAVDAPAAPPPDTATTAETPSVEVSPPSSVPQSATQPSGDIASLGAAAAIAPPEQATAQPAAEHLAPIPPSHPVDEPEPDRPSEASGSANVVPFRPASGADTKAPSLSPVERSAFHELAQELTARLRTDPDEHQLVDAEPPSGNSAGNAPHTNTAPASDEPGLAHAEQALALAPDEIAQGSTEPEFIAPSISPPLPAVAHQAEDERVLLDRVPAGVLVYRNDALIFANRHFLELTGYDSPDALTAAGGLDTLFVAPGTGALADDGGPRKLSITTPRGETRSVEARLFTVPWNGASALALTLTSAHADERERTAQTALSNAESEIRDLKSNLDRVARREAQKAAAQKADFLAKVSHEIRTPLNSMIGFAEVIMAERFGAIGNERYREYLKDMHAAGTHLVSLLNDLLDLSKIETGQLDLTFANLDLNDLVAQCVGIMQPQANRARIIIRSALTPALHHIVADARTLRQIVLNLLTNAIKYTGPGGQVIVSTAIADGGEVVLRVRDTGVGMREKDIEAVLDPFQQTSTAASWGTAGSGLGLPLTRALAEANRASFNIKSAPNAGTLVEIAFPSSRMVSP